MVQYLNNNGWEVGLHGSYRSYKDADLLKKEKTLLQEIIGHPLSGVRQHYLNLNEKTWFLQREVGFKYDSSWGYTRAIGFKENRINPFHPFNDNFTVFPLAIMDFCYMNTADRKILLNSIIRQCKKAYCEIIETCYDNNAIFNTLADFYSNYQR
jgi:hypothetical protein